MSTESNILAATKGLSIVFFSAILITLITAIYKILRRNGNPIHDIRTSILFSLIFGLCLVVISTFLQILGAFSPSINCTIPLVAVVYNTFFFPFVFGVGCCVIGVELVLSAKSPGTQTQRHILIRLGLAAVPWISGLAVALPLVLSIIDFDKCGLTDLAYSDGNAIFWVCQVVPVVLVVPTAWFAMKVKTTSDPNPMVDMSKTDQSQINTPSQTIPQTMPQQTDEDSAYILNEMSQIIVRDFSKEKSVYFYVAATFIFGTLPLAIVVLQSTEPSIGDGTYWDFFYSYMTMFWWGFCRWVAINVFVALYW